MPLRDHFRSPVNDKHTWGEVHGQWPGEIVRSLFPILPPGFQAAPKVNLGSPFEVDVSTYDTDPLGSNFVTDANEGGGVATLATQAPTLTLEADLTAQDEYEIRIYDAERDRHLVAAIEIVSPSNKDRPENRQVFIGKVASLLQQDVCVTIVDLVTIRQQNLYAELLTLIRRADPQLGRTPPAIYAVTLRTRKPTGNRKKGRPLLDVWFTRIIVGQPLPTMPIWLSPTTSVMLPLEASYEETCRLLHIT